MPRPTRRAAFFEPSAGWMVLSRISTLTLHEVRNLVDHPANFGRVLQLDRMVETTQTQTTHRRTVRLLGTDHALHESDLEILLRHHLPHNLFDSLAALGSDLGRSADRQQATDRGTHDVVRVSRTDALADHVGHAHDFEHRTHRATGDNAGTTRRRLHQDARRAMATNHRVLQGAVLERNLGQLATSFIHRLLHRDRHFTRLALAHADTAVAVANPRQRSETEDPTAFDDLG